MSTRIGVESILEIHPDLISAYDLLVVVDSRFNGGGGKANGWSVVRGFSPEQSHGTSLWFIRNKVKDWIKIGRILHMPLDKDCSSVDCKEGMGIIDPDGGRGSS